MPRRPSKKTIETLEFRGVLVLLAVVAALILYFALFSGHRPPADDGRGLPPVPPGAQPAPGQL